MADVLTEAEQEQEFDQQLFSLAGFAFIGLITIIIVLYFGVANLTSASGTFQRSIINNVAQIQALLPPTFAVANTVLNTFENLATDLFNSLTFAVVQGSQAVLNVILAVGGTIVETIQTSAKVLTGCARNRRK